jgi:hypothetical protein
MTKSLSRNLLSFQLQDSGEHKFMTRASGVAKVSEPKK